MTKNDDLINKLSQNLKPVSVKSLTRLAIQYFVTLGTLGCIFLGLLGSANGGFVRVGRGDFLLSLLVFGLAISVGSALLAQYSRPGIVLSRTALGLFWSALGVAFLIQLARFILGNGSESWGPAIEQGWACALAALVMGGVTFAVLLIEIRREAPVRLAGAARFMLLSAGAMAALVLQVHCSNENPLHQALWHIVLPLGVFALSARALSRLVLRW